jgi:hypothetical protein
MKVIVRRMEHISFTVKLAETQLNLTGASYGPTPGGLNGRGGAPILY